MLFEEYLRSSAIAGNSRSVARLFAPVGIVALLVLAALQIPLAWRMARRIRNAQRDREQLLQHAVDASDRERQLIAAGLHDGVVQELAGQSFQMAAAVEQDQPPEELRAALTEGAAGTRNAIRQLRSLLLEIYPPALRDQGLAAALPDLVAPLTARGIEVSMDVQDDLALPTRSSSLCSAPPRRRSGTPEHTRPQATSGSASSAATAWCGCGSAMTAAASSRPT